VTPRGRCARLGAVGLALGVLACHRPAPGPTPSVQEAHPKGEPVKAAAEQIERIRKGEEFNDDVSAFVKDGKIDPNALALFERALRDTEGDPREQLIRAVVETGREGDPLGAEGYPLIRDPSVVALLVKEGLSQDDTARDVVLSALARFVPPELLKPHGKALTADLEKWPSAAALELIAKAKPPEAKRVVDALSKSEDFEESEAAMVARAALGDEEAEGELIHPFVGTLDPKEKMARAALLGQAGSPGALKALASEMRSPLVYEMTRTFRKSVRVPIAEALAYNFPDQVFLYEGSINSDEDYARIEEFCEKKFGVKWTRPRPPFLRVQGLAQPPE
jgi:hypothetical protein